MTGNAIIATVKITAGAESADSSSLCRSCVNVAAASDMLTLPYQLQSSISHAGRFRSASARSLLLRDQHIEFLVGISAGLIDGLLFQDQILHRLADEFARLRIGD